MPSQRDRIAVLDVLRGLAILIMVIAHVRDRVEADGAGVAVAAWIDALLTAKGRLIFEILFGSTVAIMLGRAAASGRPAAGPFFRRLLGIALCGVLTEIVLTYPILITYAVSAIPLLFLWRWPVRVLLILALVLPAWSPIAHAVQGAYRWRTSDVHAANAAYHEPPRPRTAGDIAKIDAELTVRDGTSFIASARLGFQAFWRSVVDWRGGFALFERRTWPRVLWYFDPAVLGIFLLGVLGIRLGVFEQPSAHRRLIVAAMLFGAINWACWHFDWRVPPWSSAHVPDETTAGIAESLNVWLRAGSGQFLALTYMGAILLVWSYSKPLTGLFAWLAPVGRLALTNFIAHVVIISVLFSNWGFGWKGLRMEYVPVFGVCLFLILSGLSAAWLKTFRFGPAEWALRTLTYARPAGFRRHPLEVTS